MYQDIWRSLSHYIFTRARIRKIGGMYMHLWRKVGRVSAAEQRMHFPIRIFQRRFNGWFPNETACAGDEYLFHLPVVLLSYSAQTFHGARPSAHIFSSCSFSLTVSMHCQKPLCL